MANPKLVSEDGRRVVEATSTEELDALKKDGYKQVQRAARPATKPDSEKSEQ